MKRISKCYSPRGCFCVCVQFWSWISKLTDIKPQSQIKHVINFWVFLTFSVFPGKWPKIDNFGNLDYQSTDIVEAPRRDLLWIRYAVCRLPVCLFSACLYEKEKLEEALNWPEGFPCNHGTHLEASRSEGYQAKRAKTENVPYLATGEACRLQTCRLVENHNRNLATARLKRSKVSVTDNEVVSVVHVSKSITTKRLNSKMAVSYSDTEADRESPITCSHWGVSAGWATGVH